MTTGVPGGTPPSPSVRVVGGAWVLTVLAAVACLLALVTPTEAAVLVGLGIWFTLPGGIIAWQAYPQRDHVMWLVAPAMGYAASSLAALAIWASGGRGLWVVMVAPLLAAPVAWWGGRMLRGLLVPPRLSRRDVVTLGLVLLLVPATVGRPYARVGDVPPGREGGEAYRAYFTADFVWAMAAVAEVGKGDFPPKNPFRLGASLHYYWLAHLFPAIEHRAMPGVPLRSLLLANAVLAGLVFVSFLYALARHCTSRSWAAAVGVVCAVWATSFEGTQQLAALWMLDRPLSLVQYINIDAVTRWVYRGMPVDGLQRLLLYQPQHQLGYASAFVGLLLTLQARRAASARLGGAVGLTLAVSMLLSTFSAFMMTAVTCVVLAIRILRERAWWRAFLVAGAAGVPLAAAVWLALVLQYVEHGEGSMITIVWNALAFHQWPLMLLLSMGPVWIIGAIGLVCARRGPGSALSERRESKGTLAVVVVVSMLFYLFADVRDHEHVYVGWRAGHLIFIGFAGIAAAAAESAAQLTRAWRVAAGTVIAIAALAALPTTVIDLYNTQDISNLEMASTFRWTTWLTPDEVDALRWLREQTPADAIVQVDTRAHGSQTWAYIPAFGERRMAAGVPISMIPLARYLKANARVVETFDAPTPAGVAEACTRNGINYLWLGPHEQQRHPGLVALLSTRSDLFGTAFANHTVTVISCQ